MLEKLGEQIKLIIQLSTKNMHDFKQSVKSKIELLWLSFVAKLQVLLAVVKLQLVMVKVRVARRVGAVYAAIKEQIQAVMERMEAYAHDLSARMNHRYAVCKKTWHANQHFTFWLIPADGSHIAKTHVKKAHLK